MCCVLSVGIYVVQIVEMQKRQFGATAPRTTAWPSLFVIFDVSAGNAESGGNGQELGACEPGVSMAPGAVQIHQVVL